MFDKLNYFFCPALDSKQNINHAWVRFVWLNQWVGNTRKQLANEGEAWEIMVRSKVSDQEMTPYFRPTKRILPTGHSKCLRIASY